MTTPHADKDGKSCDSYSMYYSQLLNPNRALEYSEVMFAYEVYVGIGCGMRKIEQHL